jgi:lysophospholipase L1-like esterase
MKRVAAVLFAAAMFVAVVAAPAHAGVRPVPGLVVCCTPPPRPQPGTGQIMPLGDSITVGACSEATSGYRGPLDTRLRAAGYPPRWVGTQLDAAGLRHEGHGGYTIAQLTAGVRGGWLASPVEWVLVDAGTNDDGQGRTSAQMLADMSTLLDEVLARTGPGGKVLVAQVTITTYNTAAQQAEEQAFDSGLPALAAAKGWRVRTVDMRGVELDPDAATCPPGGVHPDDTGYQQMADRWYTAIQHWRGVL